ncbi:MAG: TetR/AcrR family transcriptional regulator [Bacteroidota bacterium]
MGKKENIKAAALQILIDNGIHATPMSAIAKAANTGMGTIYNYYPTKETLINAIYLDIKEWEEALLTAPHRKRSIKSIFIHYYLAVTNFYLEHPNYFRFIHQLQSSPIITPENKAKGYQAIQPVIAMLERGQREGVIKKISIEELLQFIGGSLLSHLAWLIMRGGKPEREVTHQNQIALVWDAIKK